MLVAYQEISNWGIMMLLCRIPINPLTIKLVTLVRSNFPPLPESSSSNFHSLPFWPLRVITISWLLHPEHHSIAENVAGKEGVH